MLLFVLSCCVFFFRFVCWFVLLFVLCLFFGLGLFLWLSDFSSESKDDVLRPSQTRNPYDWLNLSHSTLGLLIAYWLCNVGGGCDNLKLLILRCRETDSIWHCVWCWFEVSLRKTNFDTAKTIACTFPSTGVIWKLHLNIATVPSRTRGSSSKKGSFLNAFIKHFQRLQLPMSFDVLDHCISSTATFDVTNAKVRIFWCCQWLATRSQQKEMAYCFTVTCANQKDLSQWFDCNFSAAYRTVLRWWRKFKCPPWRIDALLDVGFVLVTKTYPVTWQHVDSLHSQPDWTLWHSGRCLAQQ